ncbi:SusC/RagA family TonB-linked outer membrane protein [Larkinella terrae]|uniref:SusC/RagA family TonB-linked outer membrane protein n=1 Tax=Larkinella terrae TaxID=2025311 RepID=A0A7K0EG47_9BACT|nr:TonB-dependent receptor [Larkinella terrae]MRS60418.1 SusC/RagA family TonB-linked outer membrane protein [Larkinella terrae]
MRKNVYSSRQAGYLCVLFLYALIWAVFAAPAARAQGPGLVITGVVTSQSDGNALPGVTVVVKGTTNGTVSDANGKYTLSVADRSSTLVFSYIGFVSREITIGGKTAIDVTLAADTKSLDEVVVVGYGTQKRADIVGSIAKISSADLTKVPTTSVAEAMQGMASGLYISNTSGHPGSSPEIKIRGKNSINLNTSPLWIVDGVPIQTGSLDLTVGGVKPVSPLAMLNPNDIESIEVLKDASATAIYGNRGSNGVVIVTTKSNKGNQTGISVNYDGGVSQLPFRQSDIYVDSKTWWQLIDKAWANAGNTTTLQPKSITDVVFLDEKPTISRDEALATNTDHLAAMTQQSRFHQAGFTARKGFQTGGIMFSLNYRDEKGLLRNNDFKRLTTRFNFTFSPVKSVEVGINSNFLYVKNLGIPASEGKGGAGWGNLPAMLPWYKLYDPNSQTGYWVPSSGYNGLASVDRNLIRNSADQYRTITNAYLRWNLPVSGLSLRSEAGVDLLINNSSNWRSIFLDADAPFQNQATERSITQQVFNYNTYLNYDRTFNKHTFGVTAGAEATRTSSYTRQASGTQIYSNYPELRNPLQITDADGFMSGEQYLMGMFGRVNYKFNERYILNTSIRRDGHSALSKDNRWATFKAIGAGWIISDEKFAKIPGVSLLKLRGSYGQTGNTSLSNEMTQLTWGLSSNRYGGGYLPGGTTLGPIGSTALKWETTTGLDVGLDFGFLGDRISGSVAYYSKSVSDLILRGNVPVSVGFANNQIWENVGDLKNWGWEFNVSTVNVNKGGFRWSTDFNISYNDNKIIRLNEFEKGKGAETVATNSGKGTSTIRKEGERLDTWYLANFVQIDPAKGIAMIEELNKDQWNTAFVTEATGKLIPMNQANVNANKMVQHGKSALPRFFGGMTNRVSYRNFDLNVLFAFAGGHYLMNWLYSRSTKDQEGTGQIAKAVVGKSWEKPGDVAQFPQLRWGSRYPYDNNGEPSSAGSNFNTDFTTFFLEKASYVKLRNVQLGYTLPNTLAKKAGLQSTRFYIGGTNLLTFTKFRGLDPESNDDLPIPRSLNFGLSTNF